jgi:hypothetical protein
MRQAKFVCGKGGFLTVVVCRNNKYFRVYGLPKKFFPYKQYIYRLAVL